MLVYSSWTPFIKSCLPVVCFIFFGCCFFFLSSSACSPCEAVRLHDSSRDDARTRAAFPAWGSSSVSSWQSKCVRRVWSWPPIRKEKMRKGLKCQFKRMTHKAACQWWWRVSWRVWWRDWGSLRGFLNSPPPWRFVRSCFLTVIAAACFPTLSRSDLINSPVKLLLLVHHPSLHWQSASPVAE